MNSVKPSWIVNKDFFLITALFDSNQYDEKKNKNENWKLLDGNEKRKNLSKINCFQLKISFNSEKQWKSFLNIFVRFRFWFCDSG